MNRISALFEAYYYYYYYAYNRPFHYETKPTLLNSGDYFEQMQDKLD